MPAIAEYADAIHGIVDDYLCHQYEYDWCNNEGGYGEVRIDIGRKAISHKGSINVMTTEEHDEGFEGEDFDDFFDTEAREAEAQQKEAEREIYIARIRADISGHVTGTASLEGSANG
jgi:hypothetical protein